MRIVTQGLTLLLAYGAMTQQPGCSWWLVPLPLIGELVGVVFFAWFDEWLADREFRASMKRLDEAKSEPVVMSPDTFETHEEGLKAERAAKEAAGMVN